jgi:cytochrome c biogenesis protein CcdA
LEPDHLIVISMLVARGEGATSRMRAGVLFGLGHVAVLAVTTAVVLGMQAGIPSALEQGAEIASGIVLLLLGAWSLGGTASGLVVHAHEHAHQEEGRHVHLHAHAPGDHHGHSHLSLAVGGLFAVGGVRTMILVGVPALNAGSATRAILAIALFGIGILVSMVGAGWALAQLARLVERRGSTPLMWVRRLTGLLAVVFGLVWLARSFWG